MLHIVLCTISGVGCGGGGGGSTPSPVPSAVPFALPAITLSSDRQELLYGETTLLRWEASNASSVVGSNFGATAASGTASVAPVRSTTYSITVSNGGGQTAAGSVTVGVAEVSVAVTPASGAADVSRQLPFTARVSGALNTDVSWSVQEADGGTITPEGVYSAPGVAGVYHVRAVSNADASKVAVAEVRVRAAAGSVTVR